MDDDNALIWPEEAIPHAEATEENKLLLFRGDESAVVHNPYPCFGGPGNVWPRGFPLNAINEESSVPCGVIAEKKYRHKRREAPRPLGVLQSLANHDPDVDAIYRLTYPEGCLPFNFEDSPSSAGESPPRVVPDHSMTPYNAQVKVIWRRKHLRTTSSIFCRRASFLTPCFRVRLLLGLNMMYGRFL